MTSFLTSKLKWVAVNYISWISDFALHVYLEDYLMDNESE